MTLDQEKKKDVLLKFESELLYSVMTSLVVAQWKKMKYRHLLDLQGTVQIYMHSFQFFFTFNAFAQCTSIQTWWPFLRQGHRAFHVCVLSVPGVGHHMKASYGLEVRVECKHWSSGCQDIARDQSQGFIQTKKIVMYKRGTGLYCRLLRESTSLQE